jgi:hypothetical protein
MQNYYTKIDTQFIENYGAHSEPVTNHWKFKGGDTYIIKSGSDRAANAVAFLATYLANDGNSSVEIPVQWTPATKAEFDAIIPTHKFTIA